MHATPNASCANDIPTATSSQQRRAARRSAIAPTFCTAPEAILTRRVGPQLAAEPSRRPVGGDPPSRRTSDVPWRRTVHVPELRTVLLSPKAAGLATLPASGAPG